MDDFYTDGAEAAGDAERTEPTMQQPEPAERAVSDRGSPIGNDRIVRIRVTGGSADARLPMFGPVLAAQMRPLVQQVNLSVVASIRPVLDNWHAANSRMFAASFEPFVKSVNLSIVASIEPALDAIAAYAQTTRADLLANIATITRAWPEGIGLGGVAVPKPSISGAGEVVLPGGTNVWPAIAEQFQRIGALPCGAIYGIVLALVLIALYPKLAEDIDAAALFVTVTNAIIRNGKR